MAIIYLAVDFPFVNSVSTHIQKWEEIMQQKCMDLHPSFFLYAKDLNFLHLSPKFPTKDFHLSSTITFLNYISWLSLELHPPI